MKFFELRGRWYRSDMIVSLAHTSKSKGRDGVVREYVIRLDPQSFPNKLERTVWASAKEAKDIIEFVKSAV